MYSCHDIAPSMEIQYWLCPWFFWEGLARTNLRFPIRYRLFFFSVVFTFTILHYEAQHTFVKSLEESKSQFQTLFFLHMVNFFLLLLFWYWNRTLDLLVISKNPIFMGCTFWHPDIVYIVHNVDFTLIYRLSARYVISVSVSVCVCTFFGSPSKVLKNQVILANGPYSWCIYYKHNIMIVIIMICKMAIGMFYPSQCWHYYNNGY